MSTALQEGVLFPAYIHRREEEQIRQEAERVRDGRRSRAVLLYGQGGMGKTWLVRELARTSAAVDSAAVWLEPIDVDDPEFWLLSNLERRVAEQLDPDTRYFGPYHQYLSEFPRYLRPRMGHEVVVSHLGRIKRVFLECYRKLVDATGTTVVITFDTVEAVRGMYLVLTLTQWMKALPATLFILSGRPPAGGDSVYDPIRQEFEDPHQPLPLTSIMLTAFTREAALRYLDTSDVAEALDAVDKQKLVHLTRGQPLWLAFTLDYLRSVGMPAEAQPSLTEIAREVPYGQTMTTTGRRWHEDFTRRLVTPYSDADFWHEATKRMAVVRKSVNQDIWQQLMSDLPLPRGVADWDEAWRQLLRTPWIWPRANRRYVTLHDAVAEDLARLIIPVHDQDQTWRRAIWRRALDIYAELAEATETALTRQLQALDESLAGLEQVALEGRERRTAPAVSDFLKDAAALDAEKRELDQLKAARLNYRVLLDFEGGCREFQNLLRQASAQNDLLFEELITLEMQRFLPSAADRPAYGDVVAETIAAFQAWLEAERPDVYLEIGLSMAGRLLAGEQAAAAVELLDRLPGDAANTDQRYRLRLLRGNAYLRTPHRVMDGLPEFTEALALAEAGPQGLAERQKRVAEAYKELGFFFRNVGRWQEADDAYQKARDAISEILSSGSPAADREEMASIQTNWAYVKGLRGSYREAQNLVESAISVRHRLGNTQGEGSSWSVCGEVRRYSQRYDRAWDAYGEAERIFQGLGNWPWLGQIYQQQAICLFQAARHGLNLVIGKERDADQQAKQLIVLALDICRDSAPRGYPSALNRAGRIFGRHDHELGLRYLADGIDQAKQLSDGRFLTANLIEYVELSYRAWVATSDRRYQRNIEARRGEIEAAMQEYPFSDLLGRWELLQGHVALTEWLDSQEERLLATALRNYDDGFTRSAEGYVGSSGVAIVPSEFETFKGLFVTLPDDIKAAWERELRRAWYGSTSLLARLEELY